MKEENMRFGEFIKTRRLHDPRELTIKDVSTALGMSLSMLSDIEQGRRKAFDDEKIQKFCAFLSLPPEDLATLRDLAALDKREIPADLEDTMMYSSIGRMARHAMRLANAGIGDEEDWKRFIRELEKKQGNHLD